MASNRNLGALGNVPSAIDGKSYAVVNDKWVETLFGAVTPWANLTLASGWTATTPAPQYRKNGDVVEFRGAVLASVDIAANTSKLLCTMPSGFRSGYNAGVVAITASSVGGTGSLATVTTDATGAINYQYPEFTPNSSGGLALEGIRYSTAG